jgi:NADH:ubiquinone oxidoreductase subunit 6 (subunit J)
VALPDTVPYVGIRWDDLAFLLLSGVLLGGALAVVLGRNIIRSGLFLIVSFAGLAGIYALLGATLVAAAQVLIYIGAISVLILFAIMLTQTKAGPTRLVFHHQAWAAAIASALLAGLLLAAVLFTAWPQAAAGPIVQSARDVASLLFQDYVFAFEVVSVLLLAAVIGGIFLARREPEPGGAGDRVPAPTGSRPATGARPAGGMAEEP